MVGSEVEIPVGNQSASGLPFSNFFPIGRDGSRSVRLAQYPVLDNLSGPDSGVGVVQVWTEENFGRLHASKLCSAQTAKKRIGYAMLPGGWRDRDFLHKLAGLL